VKRRSHQSKIVVSRPLKPMTTEQVNQGCGIMLDISFNFKVAQADPNQSVELSRVQIDMSTKMQTEICEILTRHWDTWRCQATSERTELFRFQFEHYCPAPTRISLRSIPDLFCWPPNMLFALR
jgi:hypothetical protein